MSQWRAMGDDRDWEGSGAEEREKIKIPLSFYVMVKNFFCLRVIGLVTERSRVLGSFVESEHVDCIRSVSLETMRQCFVLDDFSCLSHLSTSFVWQNKLRGLYERL